MSVFLYKLNKLRSWTTHKYTANQGIIHYSLLFIIVIIGGALRIDAFTTQNSYLWQSDYNRDYSIADHIVRYGERPLVGPESLFGARTNSPFYYYFLSLILFIKNDIVFLGYFNVALQVACIVLIYILARTFFNRATGLVAAILWSFSQPIIFQSTFIWQPHIMQPFTILSYLFLALGYTKRNYTFILSSIIIFIIALVMHNSMLVMVPIFFSLILWILLREKRKLIYYVGAALTAIASLAALYAPLAIYYINNPSGNSSGLSTILGNALRNYKGNGIIAVFLERVGIFFGFLFPRNDFYINLSIIVTMIALLVWYFSGKIIKNGKAKMLILSTGVISFIAITSFVHVVPSIPFPHRYFTPIFCLFIIMISELTTRTMRSGLIVKIAGIGALTLFIYGASPNLTVHAQTAIKNIGPNFQAMTELRHIENDGTKTVAKTALEIKNNEARDNLYFFQIRSYAGDTEDEYSNEILWTSLERIMAEKLIRTDGSGYRGYLPIGTDEYMFLKCRYAGVRNFEECLGGFNKNGNYRLINMVYSGQYDIYLLKRI